MDQSLTLALELLREDAQEVMSAATGKGKQLEGVETDTQLALRLFLEELQNAETSLADQQMTISIQQAVELDGGALARLREEEIIAEDDHRMSIALSNGEDGTLASQTNPPSPTDDEEFIEKLSCIYITGIDDAESENENESDQPESSAWAAACLPKPRMTRQRRACEACGDMKHFAELARAPCQHEYCRQCLSHLFHGATADESLFPPRCCKLPIGLERSRPFLDAEVVQQFLKKAPEFSSTCRTYCHNRNCAAFIEPKNCVDDTATCGECGCRTCITCKNAQHIGDCPNDERLQQVIQLAREEGWQRCQNCRRMVELETGCNHMTCRCGFQFCYVCGARWKTCRCEQWDEHRLYERAAEIDARDDEDQPGERDRPQRVQHLMDNLRRDHECDHTRWFSRGGPRECEECFNVMPIFIYECRQCHIMACRYCKRHRL
ncbi:hypothetical protein F4818DRAFT_456466 [Hypoxylon cercidicola]|nr:hypothetical protein F4818DRAFT_456466 [Hypoxylon cercidicola]